MTQTTDSNTRLRELGTALRRMAGDGLGVVRVLDRHGFGTVESGQLLAGTASGALAGVLYRGALDDAAVPLAAASAATAQTRKAHVAEPAALAAGLACSGGATLLGHPLPAALADALGRSLERGAPSALVSTADGAGALVLTGPELADVVGTLGSAGLDEVATGAARQLLRRGATVTERVPNEAGPELLLDLWVPVPSVLIVGSGAIGAALEAQAALLGWSSRYESELDATVAAVAAFSDADVLVLLDHAPSFDAALIEGLRGRGFIGALGSRHTQSARRERLLAAGLTADEMARLYGPVGLDLGARTPAETAVSIVAQVIAARAGRAGTALAAAEGRIGG
ncbi:MULTISPECIES: XdhC family protein [unclassified Pseudonocardia]|uniref:XdhC/CoxI family protein n=1 Tax=unclassified Pseudonocardia TaxID=2619320 RepID=UPI000AE0A8DA|nr:MULTISPECIES: XdhC family protein [unclassified Pseudonocardia]